MTIMPVDAGQKIQVRHKLGFDRTILQPGTGFSCPREGSVCTAVFLMEVDGGTLLDTTFELGKPTEITVGEWDTLVDHIVGTALMAMKKDEKCSVKFTLDEVGRLVKENPGASSQSGASVKTLIIHLTNFTEEVESWQMECNSKLQRAVRHKLRGAELFKAGQAENAFRRFNQAARYLVVMGKEAGIPDELKDDWRLLTAQVYLNLAICQHKHGNHGHVIENTTIVLGVDPDNIKALYRRGCAYTELKQCDKAKSDLTKALRIEPNNKAIPRELEKVISVQKKEEENMTLAMGKMFK